METNRSRLSQVFHRMNNAARERAPIAAEFEDCTQRFDRLSSVMEANETVWEPYQILLDDYRSRLAIWGNDTGARVRTIDHTLRKSSKLQTQTLELLEHLHERLQNILDLVETIATPMLVTPAATSSTSQGYFDAKTTVEDSLQYGAISEHQVQPKIETIAGIFDSLTSLVPSLQDPVPWENHQVIHSVETQKEIERARCMFEKASPVLVERLGNANWKRKCYLHELKERVQSTSQKTGFMLPARMPKRDFQLTATAPLRTSKIDEKVVPQHSARPNKTHRGAMSFITSTSLSTGSTIFSDNKHPTRGNSAFGTSIAETEDFQKPETVPERYVVPKPPVILEPYKTFLCPYCLHEITVGDKKASESDWVDHVYTDLEPYMCTYELCPQGQKTYGSKNDWFQHELNTHRIPKVYVCQACQFEYGKQELLERHLSTDHPSNLQPEELTIIASMCERLSQKSLKNQVCHLCNEITPSSENLRDHLADHLEQFALISVKSEDGFEEDLPLSPQFSDSGSEQRFRLGLGGLEDLELLVEEKTEPIFQHGPVVKQSIASFEAPHIDIEGAEPRSAMSSVMRPSMCNRGSSYTFMSRVKQHLDQQSALTGMSKISSQGDSMNVAVDQASNVASAPRTIRIGLPPRRSEFEGRIQDLKELYTRLSAPGYTCFLSGPGGIGKSALAAEYTYRFETEYSFIFWVQAETPIVCADAYSQIAAKVVLNEEMVNQNQERTIMLSREFLEKTTKRWLLVFDNVDEWLDLKQFLPTNFPETSGSILITTQKVDLVQLTGWSKTSQISIDGLSLEESRRLLLKYTQPGVDPMDTRSHPEFKLAGDIAKLAERLPLALSLIAGYILVSRCSLKDFVDLWNERRRHMQRRGEHSSSLTDAALETAWNIGLREVPGDARDLLNILAFLDPDTIQKEMLVDEHEESILEMLHSTEAGRIKRMTAQLNQRKLITIETRSGEEVWSIHRSLQAKILQDLNRDPQKRERVYAQAFILIRKRFPPPSPIQVPEPSKWPACRRYLPHVLSLRKILTGSSLDITPSIKLARLFSDGGIGLWERGMTNEGLDLLKSAESILDQIDHGEDLLRANIHVIISLLLQDSGLIHLAECKSRIGTALRIRKEYHEKTPLEVYTKNDEILLYNAWSDYGCVLLQYNNFQEAEPIFASCFEKYKTWGPPEEIPYEYAKYYHHMAFCLMYRKKFGEAIELAEEGLHWATVATGQSAAHNRWKFDLACIVLQSGDLTKALELHKEILESRKEQHGTNSFLTLQSYYAVGAVQGYIGDLSGAETSMRQVITLEASREGSCPEAAMARTRFHLAKILQQQNKSLEEAEELAISSRKALNLLRETQSLQALNDVTDEHELALFDHLQPIFDGRFTGRDILKYLARKN